MSPVVIDPETVVLQRGAHAERTEGLCVMELAAYLAHEPHSDHPACVSPVIGTFLRAWNDSLDNEVRQSLRPYARRVLGTAAQPAADERAGWLATDWLVRVHAPGWLDLSPALAVHAAALRALPAIVDAASARAAQPTIDAAGDAAGDAARAAARDATGDAARKRLAPTVAALQVSAHDLLDRMLAGYTVAP